MEEETIDLKESSKKAIQFLKNKKVQWAIVGVLLLLILVLSSYVRVQNLPLLVDSTTGENIPLALDPYYFLRVSETIVETGGNLPEVDPMRTPSLNVGWHPEIMPDVVVYMYKVAKIFNPEITLRYVNVISPVVFFAIGLIIFFFLCYYLTKSKSAALLSSAFLAFVPSYLYRTMAGFSDHEAIGILAFFAFLLMYAISLRGMSKKGLTVNRSLIYGLAVGLFSALSVATWGGVSNFVFMILPLSFFIFWNLRLKDDDRKDFAIKGLIFYVVWVISTISLGMLLGFEFSQMFSHFRSSSGIISLFVLGFSIVDYIILSNKTILRKTSDKYRQLYSLAGTIVLGGIAFTLIGGNLFSLIADIWVRLFQPWGIERVTLTVAENAQPFLIDWISQSGRFLFWFFLIGCVFIGFEISKGIRGLKHKTLFNFFWIFMISGIIFSRISSNHIFNGTNFISQVFYILGVFSFLVYSAWLYFNRDVKITPALILIASWMFFTLIGGKAAQRIFFAVTPFVAFSAGFAILKTFEYFKGSKEELLKMIFGIGLVILLLVSMFSIYTNYNNINQQAKVTGPSAGQQWQNAMAGVRENTSEGDIFLHWWDYGYWVQTLGERPTFSDGGHSETSLGDHFVGRYVLTTPQPETALSFMKTQNISYLLIDPTDIGKYSAYSRIGSDEAGTDRYSWLPTMIYDPKQTQETSSGMTRVYQGGFAIDDDIMYELNGTEIFLPEGKSYVLGVLIEIQNNSQIKQPIGVFLYNNQQYRIPIRYLYINEELTDFQSGLEANFRILPKVDQSSNGGISIDQLGAGIYLSERTKDSLVAQLYLMDDPLDNYPTLEVVHVESEPVVSLLNAQGANLGELVYFNGIRGPIKIWNTQTIPDNILVREEFIRNSYENFSFGDMDNLAFIEK